MSRTLHIGMDISRISVATRTGTENYSYELLAALARIDHVNRYTLYCSQPPAALPPLGTNFALRRIPFPRLWTHARLSLEMLLHPPDVLFVPAHVLPLGAPLRRKLRTVVTIHDLGYLHFPAAHTWARRLNLRLSTVWSARAATQLIAISATTRADLTRFTGVDQQQVTVIHHGVDTRFCQIKDPAALATVQAKYRIQAPYFLYVGTIQPRKNLVRLIDAFAQFNQTNRDAAPLQLVIAGKRGWLTTEIESQAARLFGPDSTAVRFTGYIDNDDLPALLSGAQAFIFPSLYEGFGMPVLEAMACGTPVLTSSNSALPEVAGDAALLVDPADTAAISACMARLASDAALRADLRSRGLVHAAKFTWERCAAETLAVLTAQR